MKRTLSQLAAGVIVLLLVGTGCSTAKAPGSANHAPAPAKTQTLTVFAAASLKVTFTELGSRFEAGHQGTAVRFSFAGSSDLVAQLQQGAPADVFASADTTTMDKATGDGLLSGEPVDFAANTLQIAVPPDNPAKIASFADLAEPGVKVVICAAQVPCGSATQQVETATGTDLKPVSEENSVTDVLNKVTSGEADAGLVYRTDVIAAGDKVKGIAFPQAGQAVNVYPIAVLASSRNPRLAQQFVDLIVSDQGRGVLADAGFARP